MTIPAGAACQNHPTREALGVCVRCRRRVCSECTTRIEGINYCEACLGRLAAESAVRGRTGRRPGLAPVSAVLHLGLLWLLVWGLLEVALPGVGG